MTRVLDALLAPLVAVVMLIPSAVLAGAGELEIEQEIAQATAAWVEAYNSRDAARISALYASDALFWGTRSTAIANQPEQIAAYFRESVKNPNLRVRIEDRRIRVYHHIGVSAGTYTLTDSTDGQEVSTPGRFTLVFEKRGDRWMIVHHHSSRMPAP